MNIPYDSKYIVLSHNMASEKVYCFSQTLDIHSSQLTITGANFGSIRRTHFTFRGGNGFSTASSSVDVSSTAGQLRSDHFLTQRAFDS